MPSAALQSFRRTVTIAWPKAADEEARQRLIRIAKAGNAKIVAEQTARAGFPPEVEAYANTPGNRNIESVRLPGPIVYRYRYHREILSVALAELERASPVVSGLYRGSHTVFVNGLPVVGVPASLKAGDEVYITNPVPYSRRLEVGLTESGRSFVVQVPPNIYGRVMRSVLIPRYHNVAKIFLDYVTIPGAYVIKGRLPSHYIAKGGVRRRRRQKAGTPVRAPAIVIALK